MRKVLLTVVSVLFVVLVGGYIVVWYSQATAAKNGLVQAIERVNARNKILSYESIETAGFPSNVEVVIVKPRISGRIDLALKALADASPNGVDKIAAREDIDALPEWNEDLVLDGKIVFGINALSDKYSFRLAGNWLHKGTIGSQTMQSTSQQSGDTVCELEFQRSGGTFGALWNFRAVLAEGRDFLRDFRLLECNSAASVTTDDASREKLMSNGPARFFISSIPQGTARSVRVALKSADAEITPQGDRMIGSYITALSPGNSYPSHFSFYGKQNMEMEFAYNGPSDISHPDPNPTLDVQLSKFTITSQVYNADMTFALTNQPSGANRSSRLAYRFAISFGDQYNVLMQDVLRNLIKEIYSSKDPHFSGLQPYLQRYTMDETYAILATALPDFHALGTLVDALDVSYQGTADMTAGDVTLTALELSATPYGITGKGSAKMTAGRPVPAANVTMACTNCPALIDDMAAYQTRLQTVVNYYDTQAAAQMTVNPQLVDGIKQFLAALAESNGSDPKVYTYTFVSDGGGSFTISGKQIDEVMALFAQHIAPHVRGAAPVLPVE